MHMLHKSAAIACLFALSVALLSSSANAWGFGPFCFNFSMGSSGASSGGGNYGWGAPWGYQGYGWGGYPAWAVGPYGYGYPGWYAPYGYPTPAPPPLPPTPAAK